ncbi:MAG: hypothetical protein ACI32N_07125 [Bulleidia sp.]
MKDIIYTHLEELCDALIETEKEEIADQISEEIADIIISGDDILIDGVQLEDGSIDPEHLLVDMDDRYYFHVFTSMQRFNRCQGKHPYVLPLASLMEPIYAEDSFGGLALNHKKGDPMVLISKEMIYECLRKRIPQA